nr:hypothetical protein [Tanacetum cinerariifolium]
YIRGNACEEHFSLINKVQEVWKKLFDWWSIEETWHYGLGNFGSS